MNARAIRRTLAAATMALVPVVALATTARADITDSSGTNIHEGDAEADARQDGSSGSGDAVGGQVGGLVVSGGVARVDARNRSQDADVASGDSAGSNTAAALVGQDRAGDVQIDAADISNIDEAANVQEGDDALELVQAAAASSGDAVGGQVLGAVVSAGTTEIVADNASEDVDVATGGSEAVNDSASSTSHVCPDTFTLTADIEDVATICAVQEGDNEQAVAQTSDAASGDGVGGQVVGTVSAGETSIDARNASEDVGLGTGVATADNAAATSVGHDCPNASTIDASDVTNIDEPCTVQEGDNARDTQQDASAYTGDGVGGQVVGAVTAAGGSNDIVAANDAEDVDASTGDAVADNDVATFTGHDCPTVALIAADVGNVDDSCSAQEGDNELSTAQTAGAASGDGVGGQVIGSVSAGDASIDARNTSEDVDLDTGVATAENSAAGFVGLTFPDNIDIFASDVSNISDTDNVQEGDNAGDVEQSATASTGDGVGGQVVGAVTSAGASADVVAENTSEDADIDTGDATADDSVAFFVGLDYADDGDVVVGASDIDGVIEIGEPTENVQEGDNDLTLAQTADAASGDGVGGEVIGIVAPGGSTSLDARNASTDVDLATGDALAANRADAFVGLNDTNFDLVVGADITNAAANNIQDGDNTFEGAQAASASTGDAVGGLVAGAVVTGGVTDVVLENASEDVDASTGGATFENGDSIFVGLALSDGRLVVGGGSLLG